MLAILKRQYIELMGRNTILPSTPSAFFCFPLYPLSEEHKATVPYHLWVYISHLGMYL